MEDVHFMRRHSVRQSFVFLVDSRDRDRAAWPTPAQYTVDFAAPFHHVVGLELLEADVPRTMYNVDAFNKTLRFCILSAPAAGDGADLPWTTVTVPAGDYTIHTLAPALTAALAMRVDGDAARPLAAVTASAVSNPPELLGKLQFTCPYPFAFDMAASSLAETLGFDTLTTPAEAELYRALDARRFASVDRPPEAALGPSVTLFEGPRGVLYAQGVTATRWVAQRFAPAVDGYLSGVEVALQTPGAVQWAVLPGTAAAPDAAAAPLAAGSLAVSATDGGLSDAVLGARPRLTGGATYWLVLRSAAAVYYNDVADPALAGGFRVRDGAGAAWTPLDADGIVYAMSATVTMAEAYHRLEAPGMYSLVGERYVTLRCPQVEEKSYRNAPSQHELGLGKIRLGVVGFSQQRLDYNKAALRELFPIGRLPRITLRFEAANGQLYDFRGVNHSLVLVLHFYKGVQASNNDFTGASILNPNYRPNFLDYVAHQDEQEEISDDQSIDYNEDGEELAQWQLRQMRNLPEQRRLQDLELLRSLGDPDA